MIPKLLTSAPIRLLTVASTLFTTVMSNSTRSVIFPKVTTVYKISWLDKEMGFLVSEDRLAANC